MEETLSMILQTRDPARYIQRFLQKSIKLRDCCRKRLLIIWSGKMSQSSICPIISSILISQSRVRKKMLQQSNPLDYSTVWRKRPTPEKSLTTAKFLPKQVHQLLCPHRFRACCVGVQINVRGCVYWPTQFLVVIVFTVAAVFRSIRRAEQCCVWDLIMNFVITAIYEPFWSSMEECQRKNEILSSCKAHCLWRRTYRFASNASLDLTAW